MKSELTPSESAHLIELGVDPSKASENTEYGAWADSEYGRPIFTLPDVLSLLPKEIEVYYDGETIPYHLVITTNGNGWEVSYYDNEALRTAPELIDALYNLVVWCITNENITL